LASIYYLQYNYLSILTEEMKRGWLDNNCVRLHPMRREKEPLGVENAETN
jgi:hypothetical protein